MQEASLTALTGSMCFPPQKKSKSPPKRAFVTGPVSRILYPPGRVVTIPLGRRLLVASSDLPGNFSRAGLKRSPIWSCSGWGLPALTCLHADCELLPHSFHPYPSSLYRQRRRAATGGIVSVALSLGSPRVGVTDHPALWSPDFPPFAGIRTGVLDEGEERPPGRVTFIVSENRVSGRGILFPAGRRVGFRHDIAATERGRRAGKGVKWSHVTRAMPCPNH